MLYNVDQPRHFNNMYNRSKCQCHSFIRNEIIISVIIQKYYTLKITIMLFNVHQTFHNKNRQKIYNNNKSQCLSFIRKEIIISINNSKVLYFKYHYYHETFHNKNGQYIYNSNKSQCASFIRKKIII